MKKLLLILAFPTVAFAGGPKSTFPEPRGLDAEFVQVYHDIANPVINIGTASTMTVTYIQVDSMTIRGQMNSVLNMGNNKITNLTNGSSSTDAAAFGQIKLFQVIQGTTSTQTSTTSTTFINSTLSAKITPTSASSRILVMVFGGAESGSGEFLGTIFRNTTDIGPGGTGMLSYVYDLSAAQAAGADIGIIDSPATTSEVSYTLKIRSSNAGFTVRFPGSSLQAAYIILAEIT